MAFRGMGFAVATAMVMSATAVFAKPVVYDCKPEKGRRDSVIQPEYVISYDKASGEVLVNDPIIMDTVGKPIQGKLQSESDVRTVFDWRLKSLKGPTDTTSWQFRARIKADGKLSLSVTPVGYDNQFSSEGHCTVQK